MAYRREMCKHRLWRMAACTRRGWPVNAASGFGLKMLRLAKAKSRKSSILFWLSFGDRRLTAGASRPENRAYIGRRPGVYHEAKNENMTRRNVTVAAFLKASGGYPGGKLYVWLKQ